MNLFLVFITMLFLGNTLYGMSEKESKLFNMVKQSHANYMFDDYLQMTPQQRLDKEKQQQTALNEATATGESI